MTVRTFIETMSIWKSAKLLIISTIRKLVEDETFLSTGDCLIHIHHTHEEDDILATIKFIESLGYKTKNLGCNHKKYYITYHVENEELKNDN